MLDKACVVTRALLQDEPIKRPKRKKIKRQDNQNQHLEEENTEKDIKSHLKETTPENWNAASSIEVHQLEDISSSLGKMVIMNKTRPSEMKVSP